MTRRNPESLLTDMVRSILESRGAYTFKLSDSFTRGVPDMVAVGSKLRMVELKIAKAMSGTVTYKSLGLSGAQHQRIIEMCRRDANSAVVVTGTPGDASSLKVWVPKHPDDNTKDEYVIVADGMTSPWSAIDWLLR